jgi:putative flippase GtrA
LQVEARVGRIEDLIDAASRESINVANRIRNFVVLGDPKVQTILYEFSRFAAVGAVATIVHYSVLISLVELAHGPLIPSTSTGFVFGAILSYGLNRRITFRHQPSFGRGLLKFIAVGAVGLGLNALIVAGLARGRLPYIPAQMAATGVVLVWNFAIARLVIFRPQTSDA